MVSADEDDDHDARFIVGVAPSVACAILNDRVTWAQFPLCASIEFEYAAPGNDKLIINRSGPMHCGIAWLKGLAKTGEFFIQLACGRFHVDVLGQ